MDKNTIIEWTIRITIVVVGLATAAFVCVNRNEPIELPPAAASRQYATRQAKTKVRAEIHRKSSDGITSLRLNAFISSDKNLQAEIISWLELSGYEVDENLHVSW